MTTAQGPRVPQPMGNQPVSTAQLTRNHLVNLQQPIPPPVSQSVGQNLSYTFNSHPIQITQVPLTIPQSINAPSAPHLNMISQSCAMPTQHSSMMAQSYVTQTLPLSQSLTTPHDHSVHNIPENTTLPMLNPWQRQSIFE